VRPPGSELSVTASSVKGRDCETAPSVRRSEDRGWFARHPTNRGLDLVNLREQRFMHGHLVCPAHRSAVADAPITRAPRG